MAVFLKALLSPLTRVPSSPAVQNSGQGGRFQLPDVNITAPGGEFGSIPVGAPYFGHDDNDTNICKHVHSRLFPASPLTTERPC